MFVLLEVALLVLLVTGTTRNISSNQLLPPTGAPTPPSILLSPFPLLSLHSLERETVRSPSRCLIPSHDYSVGVLNEQSGMEAAAATL